MADMTHRISIKLADGGTFAVFDATLGLTGGVITKVRSFAEPIPADFIADCLEILNLVGKLNVKYKGIKSIAIMENDFRDQDVRYLVDFTDLPAIEQAKYTKK